VLTHHPHDPIEMEGGTTFHFVDDVGSALDQAFAAAGGADVRIGGGPAPIQQYLRAGLVDWMHVAVVPTLLGGGERLFVDDLGSLGYEVVEHVPSASVTHVVLARQGG
jgi:dihydrofolate reductase